MPDSADWAEPSSDDENKGRRFKGPTDLSDFPSSTVIGPLELVTTSRSSDVIWLPVSGDWALAPAPDGPSDFSTEVIKAGSSTAPSVQEELMADDTVEVPDSDCVIEGVLSADEAGLPDRIPSPEIIWIWLAAGKESFDDAGLDRDFAGESNGRSASARVRDWSSTGFDAPVEVVAAVGSTGGLVVTGINPLDTFESAFVPVLIFPNGIRSPDKSDEFGFLGTAKAKSPVALAPPFELTEIVIVVADGAAAEDAASGVCGIGGTWETIIIATASPSMDCFPS